MVDVSGACSIEWLETGLTRRDSIQVRTYWFNNACEGQIIFNCPGPGGTARARGLTYFSFGRGPLMTSRFETTDSLVKGLTSEMQVVVNAPGKTSARTNMLWSDFMLELSVKEKSSAATSSS